MLHGSEEPRVYHVPVGRDGTVWNVFSINRDGTITDLNTFGYAYDYEVGSDYVNASVRRGTMKFAGMKKGISNKKSNKKQSYFIKFLWLALAFCRCQPGYC